MVLMCVSLVRDLGRDGLTLRTQLGRDLVEKAVISGVAHHDTDEIALVAVPADDMPAPRGATPLEGANGARHEEA